MSTYLYFFFSIHYQIRKLEFLLAEAIDQGCRHVITCGGIQSNHVRATVVAATQLGLKAHALLRTDVSITISFCI